MMVTTLQSLGPQSLARVARRGIAVPAYARQGVQPSVVHLGLGAFHRAHQAMVFDALMAGGDKRWGVLGVATRSWQLADTLAAQEGLYAVKLASAAGASWRVVGAILQTCAATRTPGLVQAAIASPSTRWVTLTVTEKGYDQNLVTLLVEGLRQRCDAGLQGLTIASCDNLSHNGDKLKTLCLEASTGHALTAWITRECRFPNSMVDRIVPAASIECMEEAAAVLGVSDKASLATETFWQWVIENNFVQPGDGPVLSGAGVTVVPDVKPYEDAKLRLLNGSHSALACLGALTGLQTVVECVSQQHIRRFIHQLMSAEVIPNLTRPDLTGYRDSLLERFANPEIKHGVHQIATDSSKKIGLRWVPSIAAQLHAGRPVSHHAFAAAAWMRYCLGEDDQGRPYAINDPQADLMMAIALTNKSKPAQTVNAFFSVPSIWGDLLGNHQAWKDEVARWLGEIDASGTAHALQVFLDIGDGR